MKEWDISERVESVDSDGNINQQLFVEKSDVTFSTRVKIRGNDWQNRLLNATG